jgi:hypothetical protein
MANLPSPPSMAGAGSPSRPAETETWTAVVAADRAYYDSVQAVSDTDAASIAFPAFVPERRFRLSGAEVRIGRRSVSRHIDPEIDLTAHRYRGLAAARRADRRPGPELVGR